jgi:hypothetical protein
MGARPHDHDERTPVTGVDAVADLLSRVLVGLHDLGARPKEVDADTALLDQGASDPRS